MRRTLCWLLALALLTGGVIGPAAAEKKKKKKKPVMLAVDQAYFLRRDACGQGSADNPRLSIADGPDQACAWVDTGIFAEVYEETDTLDPWETFSAIDGTPLVLNATEPITGEITLYGLDCVTADAPGGPGGRNRDLQGGRIR